MIGQTSGIHAIPLPNDIADGEHLIVAVDEDHNYASVTFTARKPNS